MKNKKTVTNKINPPQSNKLHYTKDIENSGVLGFRCEIHTRTLTIPHLDPQRVQRLELLEKLHNQGLSDKQISTWFNDLRTENSPTRKSVDDPKHEWVTKRPSLINKNSSELKIRTWRRKWENPPPPRVKRTDKRTSTVRDDHL